LVDVLEQMLFTKQIHVQPKGTYFKYWYIILMPVQFSTKSNNSVSYRICSINQ
jgi:hypothetical protein